MLTFRDMLALRQWAYTTVFGYLRTAFEESANGQRA